MSNPSDLFAELHQLDVETLRRVVSEAARILETQELTIRSGPNPNARQIKLLAVSGRLTTRTP
jgi:hypothetical protein